MTSKMLVLDLDDRDVERAAAEVVDGDRLVEVLAEAVGERGGGGLVEDAHDLEAASLPASFDGLALAVVEVGGDGDHGAGRPRRRATPRRPP